MTKQRELFVIPADPKEEQLDWAERQIRVAAYCRVSTDSDEQQNSYEIQKDYYTDKIMENPYWIMAGIFADEGLSATSAAKRPAFQKMIRKCKQGKIDLILTKSVSRFARNTLDCINLTRQLRELGVAVYFEKENINTMEMDSEFTLTIMGSLAQAESENISKNVAWGKRQSMKEGKFQFPYGHIYGYERGEDNQPKIVPEQAEAIRRIFNWYLAGATAQDIINRLAEEEIQSPKGAEDWTDTNIRGILKNEKYCGDVIQQKTFIADVISRRVVKNTGQLPKYLIKNNHVPIISRELFHKVQAEIAKRSSKLADKKSGEKGYRYSGKFALTDILICAECGTAYRRRVWTKRSGERIPVWRCINRLDNGKKYCKSSPTLREHELQDAILNAIRTTCQQEEWQISDHMPIQLVNRAWVQKCSPEIQTLKKGLMNLLMQDDCENAMTALETEIVRVQDMISANVVEPFNIVKDETPLVWDEILIRNLISRVIVDTNLIHIKFKNGKQVNAVLVE